MSVSVDTTLLRRPITGAFALTRTPAQQRFFQITAPRGTLIHGASPVWRTQPPQRAQPTPSRNVAAGAKRIPLTSGKVEHASEVAAAAYSGLPLVWQATLRLVGITAGAIIASRLIVGAIKWAARDLAEEADELGGKYATDDSQKRSTWLRVLEMALKAAYKPITLLLPAATTILALRASVFHRALSLAQSFSTFMLCEETGDTSYLSNVL